MSKGKNIYIVYINIFCIYILYINIYILVYFSIFVYNIYFVSILYINIYIFSVNNDGFQVLHGDFEEFDNQNNS